MFRRISIFLGFTASFFLFFLTTSQAQTRPRVQVPVEESSQAQAIVQKLLQDGRIIRSSEVKRGMRGFGRSVFQGTEIEEFPIEVIGVLERVQGGGDIVLVRILGGTVVKRNSGLVAGMSGSPIYINGKMLGAIAMGWGFPKEPIGGVTPITEMIQTSLPDTVRREVVQPQGQQSTLDGERQSYRPKEPLNLAGHEIKNVVVSRDNSRVALSGPRDGATMTMRPATTLLQISGMREQSLPLLRRIFEPYQLEPIIGPASQKSVPSPPIMPGSAMGVQLVSGDMDQTAVGTVTFRWGDRILGFGHPMFGQGPASIPIASSYVHDIFPSYQRSFKLASPIKVIGAMQQDTQFAVGGTMGAVADTIPMSVSLRDAARGINRTFNVQVMKDPVLTPQLIGMVATEAIETTLGLSSDKMVKVGMTMEIDGAPDIVRSNLLYTQGPVTAAAISDLRQTLMITQSNEFARGSIRRLALSVTLDDSRRIALIKSMAANRNKVRAGETVQINVQLEPIATPNKFITKTFEFTVPKDAPDGVMRVVAAPGASFWGGQVRAGGPPPEPSNLQELVAAWNQVGALNELLVQVSTPNTFLQVNNQKVPNPPPAWSALLRSSSATGVAAYNEVETQRVSTDMSLSGAQFLTIAVESIGYRERGDNNDSGPSPSPATPSPASGASPGSGAPPVGDVPSAESQTQVPAPASQTMLMDNRIHIGNGQDWIVNLAGGSDALNTQISATQSDTAQSPNFWQNLATSLQTQTLLQTQVIPPRERPDRPITPTLTSPTPRPSPTPAGTPTPKPSPTPTPKPTAKSLARPAQSWVQNSAADFLRGEMEAAQITNQGDVRPAPPSTLLATTAAPFIWSITADTAGNTYLGTSNPARILRIAANGEQTKFYESNEVAVNALTSDRNGNIYAGLSPGGRVLRFDNTGQATTIFDAQSTFIWALEWDDQGQLLIATGGESGQLYRLDNAATSSTASSEVRPIATVPQNHIRAVAVRGNEIFFGTGDEGVLWRMDGTNPPRALFQVGARRTSTPTAPSATTTTPTTTTLTAGSGGEILAVAASPEGIYFGTSSNGTLYRWHEDNVEELYPAPQRAVYALKRTGDGTLYMATGNSGIVYQVRPGRSGSDTHVARLLEPMQLQALSLALTTDQNFLLVGTGNNGAAHRVALQSDQAGIFTSPVFDANNIVRWGALRLIGSGVSIETRSGNTQEPDVAWSEWQSATLTPYGEMQTPSPAARYLQYRARLSTATPDSHLSRVEIIYRTRNQAPVVAFTGTPGGSYWSGKQTVTWAGKDPDQDTLRYRLWISAENEQNWKEVELTNPTASSFSFDTTTWPDGIYRLKIEGSDEVRNPEDPLRAQDITQPLTIDNSDPVIVEAKLENAGADGSLRLHLTATDLFSPIAGAEWRWKTAESAKAAETEADDDDANGEKEEPTVNPTPQSTPADELATQAATGATQGATQSGASEGTISSVTLIRPAATPKPDDPEWNATAAVDGIFDSRREEATALLPPFVAPAPKEGEEGTAAATRPTAIEVRVHDSAGNSTIQTVPLP